MIILLLLEINCYIIDDKFKAVYDTQTNHTYNAWLEKNGMINRLKMAFDILI
jgi:hypothetical protein